MKLMIDIPAKMYDSIKKNNTAYNYCAELKDAILLGTPYLENNGSLSLEEIDKILSTLQNCDEELNQEIKSDAGKIRPTLVPTGIIKAIARVREYGLRKYGDKECWKKVEVQRYRDAAYRHWLAYLEDPDSIDMESGILHLWHLACNIAFLIELDD